MLEGILILLVFSAFCFTMLALILFPILLVYLTENKDVVVRVIDRIIKRNA